VTLFLPAGARSGLARRAGHGEGAALTPRAAEEGGAPELQEPQLGLERIGATAARLRAGRASAAAAPAQPDFAHGVALYLDDITVSFDGFKALERLSLAIDVGELRCIIGPNGAARRR
jgi:urea transport system ATP-binding protein